VKAILVVLATLTFLGVGCWVVEVMPVWLSAIGWAALFIWVPLRVVRFFR